MTSSSSHNLSIAEHQTTIWESFLIDKEQLKRYAQSIDWEKERDFQEKAALRLCRCENSCILQAKFSRNQRWIHQVSSGLKPIPVTGSGMQAKVRQYSTGSIDNTIDNNDLEGLESPVFGITA